MAQLCGSSPCCWIFSIVTILVDLKGLVSALLWYDSIARELTHNFSLAVMPVISCNFQHNVGRCLVIGLMRWNTYSPTVWKQSALLNLLDCNHTGECKRTNFCPAMVWLHSEEPLLAPGNAIMLYLRFEKVSVWNMEWRRDFLPGKSTTSLPLHTVPVHYTCSDLVQPSLLAPSGHVCSASFNLEIAAQRFTSITGTHPARSSSRAGCPVEWGELKGNLF